MSDAEKIQAVINTLETLTIPATFDNVNRLLGIYKTLGEIRDRLAAAPEIALTEEAAGNG